MEDPTEDVVENEMRGRIPAVFRKHKCRKEDYTPVYDRVQQVQVVLSMGFKLAPFLVIRMPKAIVQIGMSILQHRLELVSKVQLVIYQPQVKCLLEQLSHDSHHNK